MLRKFYFYYGENLNPKPAIAALGFLNSKAFEDACKEQGIYFENITEEQALRGLERLDGVGAGAYVAREQAKECELKEKATNAYLPLASIVPCLHVETPIRLEPHRQIVLA